MEYIVTEKNGLAIQESVNRAAASGGGKIILAPGVYPSGTIHLKSNIELHLPAGAIIQGYPKTEMYDDIFFDGFDSVTPENSRKALIVCNGCENVSITGSGTIDGQGCKFFDCSSDNGMGQFNKPAHPRPRMIQFFQCRNIRFEGVSFVNSPNWTFWLSECEDVRVSGIRITGDLRICNNDGIDIDSCRRVLISDSFFQTGDDCIILRAIRKDLEKPAICEQVSVTNCILNSHCQGIRLGCPSDDTIRNCSFSNIIFKGVGTGIHSEHPFRYLRKNCTGYMQISDIVFENFDITTNRYPIRLGCDAGIKLRGIERINFKNIRIKSKRPISLEGSCHTVLKNITFSDISGNVEGESPIVAKCVKHLKLNNFELSAEIGQDVPFQRIQSKSWETQF